MTYRGIVLLVAVATAACTRSPLTDPHIVLRGATRGDVPRDGNGEPILDRVRPVPQNAIVAPPPPTPR